MDPIELEDFVRDVSDPMDQDRPNTSSEIDGSQASISTLRDEEFLDGSQNLSLESSSEFLKYPSLSQMYRDSHNRNGRRHSTCRSCSKVIKTNELNRLMSHGLNCSFSQEVKAQVAAELDEMQSNAPKDKLNILITEMLVENNISFKTVESQAFIRLMKFCCPRFQPPKRQDVSKIYVSRLSRKAKADFMSSLKSGNPMLSMEFDHWRDGIGRSLLGIVATNERGDRFLCNLKDTSLEGHSTANTVNHLKESLLEFQPEYLNAIVSDSDSSCKAAREQLVTDARYKHLIQHRCYAHFINLIGSSFCENRSVKPVIEWAARVSAYASMNTRIKAVLRESGVNQVQRFTPTRWYSTACMIESLLNAENAIAEEIPRVANPAISQDMSCEQSWIDIRLLGSIIKPLAHCIGIAERKDGTLGQTMRALLDLGNNLFSDNWRDPTTMAAVRAYLTYMSPKKLGDEFELLVLSYMLDRKHKMDFLTQDAIDKAQNCLMTIARKAGLSALEIDEKIVPEFEAFSALEDPYKLEPGTMAPAEWWSKQTGHLPRFAIRICNLRSSSANIERTFSALKYIQGDWRLNLGLETMQDLTRLRIKVSSGASEILDDLIPAERVGVNSRDDLNCASQPRGDSSITCEFASSQESSSLASDRTISTTCESRLALLDDESLRVSYTNFISLFDFTLITRVRSVPPLELQQADEDALQAASIQRSRLRREQRLMRELAED